MSDQPAMPPIRPFSEFIRETNRGRTHDELTLHLHDLVEAVRQYGRKGTLTLTITVAPLAKNDDSQFTVTEEIKVSAPKPDPRPSIYFADREGNLTQNDPTRPTFEEFSDLPDRDA